MNLLLKRKVYTDKSTIGTLMFDSFTCDTLEPPRSSGKLTPAGTYQCGLWYSPKHNAIMLRIMGFDSDTREIHPGNKPEDTEGCTLVGEYAPSMPDWISNSRYTYTCYWGALLENLKTDHNELTITIQ